MVCKALRACHRMELPGAAPSFCITPVHVRRHQTLGSASLPVACHSVRHVRVLEEERLMVVEWEDGGQSLYPFTWLRDNCQCPVCTLQSAEARLLLLADLDIHTGVDSVEVTKDGKVGPYHNPTCFLIHVNTIIVISLPSTLICKNFLQLILNLYLRLHYVALIHSAYYILS